MYLFSCVPYFLAVTQMLSLQVAPCQVKNNFRSCANWSLSSLNSLKVSCSWILEERGPRLGYCCWLGKKTKNLANCFLIWGACWVILTLSGSSWEGIHVGPESLWRQESPRKDMGLFAIITTPHPHPHPSVWEKVIAPWLSRFSLRKIFSFVLFMPQAQTKALSTQFLEQWHSGHST